MAFSLSHSLTLSRALGAGGGAFVGRRSRKVRIGLPLRWSQSRPLHTRVCTLFGARLSFVPDQPAETPRFREETTPLVGTSQSPGPRLDRRRRRDDWRAGGRQIYRWDSRVLVVALLCAGLGLVGAGTTRWFAAAQTSLLSTVALWLGLSVGVLFAFFRARPTGLLRFRLIDLLWGVGIGLILRLIAGGVAGANSLTFPVTPAGGDVFSTDLWGSFVLPAGFIGPLVEEMFFRGVLLVVLYQLLRRAVGSLAAAISALLFTTAAFLMLHALFSSVASGDDVQLVLVGLTCGSLVLLTGRLWPAVLAHMVYNVSFVMIALVGSALT